MKANFPAALAVAILSFLIFRYLYLRRVGYPWRGALIFTSLALAVPSIWFASNYVLDIPYADWFINFHALPGAEITSGLVGAWLGIMFASSRLRPGPLNGSILIVCSVLSVILTCTPFLKQLYNPLDLRRLHHEMKDGICLQTTSVTCIPACAATVMRMQGSNITEPELARQISTASGTEVWYLKRALARQDFAVGFGSVKSIRELPINSILFVSYTGVPHVVVLLAKDSKTVTVGEPLRGRRSYDWRMFKRFYSPHRSYMTIKRLPSANSKG